MRNRSHVSAQILLETLHFVPTTDSTLQKGETHGEGEGQRERERVSRLNTVKPPLINPRTQYHLVSLVDRRGGFKNGGSCCKVKRGTCWCVCVPYAIGEPDQPHQNELHGFWCPMQRLQKIIRLRNCTAGPSQLYVKCHLRNGKLHRLCVYYLWMRADE